MDDHVAIAGTNHRQAIDARGEVREEIGNLDPALAVLAESPPGAKQLRAGLDELIFGFPKLFRPWLAVKLVEQRLGIEGFEMTRPARHEKEDRCFRFRRLVRGSGVQ